MLDNFTTITNSDYTAADFNDKTFMVTSVPSSTTLTITMPSAETGSGATTSGGIRVQHYYPVGPAEQLPGFGWGLGQYGGTVSGEATTTLNGALLDDTANYRNFNYNNRCISVSNTGTNFIQIGNEEISYTGISAVETL